MSAASGILQTAAKIIGKHLKTKVELISSITLSEPERRNLVMRLIIKYPTDEIPKGVILKQSLPKKSAANDQHTFSRFASNWAGLEFLNQFEGLHHVPKFYGGSQKHRFILSEDLGEKHVSLVDSLTLSDKASAIAALERFMKAIGSLHAVSFGHTNQFQQIIKKIDSTHQNLQIDLSSKISKMIKELSIVNKKFELNITSEITNEIKKVVKSRFMPGPFTTLIHGDICPDNVFDYDQKELQLIDFEYAYIGNALLDGAYLRMSMPTCWCAKSIPGNIIDDLELIYRQELKRTIPAAANDLIYNVAYVEACAYWMLKTLNHINDVWDKEEIGYAGPVPKNSLWKNHENLTRPRIISRLQAFIDQANKYNMLPSLKEMAVKILEKIKFIWPDAKPLEVYPAFL